MEASYPREKSRNEAEAIRRHNQKLLAGGYNIFGCYLEYKFMREKLINLDNVLTLNISTLSQNLEDPGEEIL